MGVGLMRQRGPYCNKSWEGSKKRRGAGSGTNRGQAIHQRIAGAPTIRRMTARLGGKKGGENPEFRRFLSVGNRVGYEVMSEDEGGVGGVMGGWGGGGWVGGGSKDNERSIGS